MLFAIFAMISCGTSEEECTNHETVVEETVVEETTLDVSEIETVGELLDTLESIPSEPVVE